METKVYLEMNRRYKMERLNICIFVVSDTVSKSTLENILNISEKTVRNHISNTMQKLGVKGRASAVVELIKLHEISL